MLFIPVVLTAPGYVYLLRESGVLKLGPFPFPKAIVVYRLRLSVRPPLQPTAGP
jgi:hypothetical protein